MQTTELYKFFKNKKILIVLGYLGLGGAEIQAAILADYLREKINADIEFLSFRNGNPIILNKRKHKYSIFYFKLSYPLIKKIKLLIILILKIRKIRPDYIIPYTLAPNKAIGLIWKFTGTDYAMWNQRNSVTELTNNKINRFILKNVSDIVSNSYKGKISLTNDFNLNQNKVKIINNGIIIPDKSNITPLWRKYLQIPDNTFIVTQIANFNSKKDHETLIKAWEIVINNLKTLKQKAVLLLAGRFGNTYPKAKKLTYLLNLQDSVYFLGETYNINSLISESELCVLSSRYEGCPNAVLEAMALAKPVIGTNIPGIKQALGEKYKHLCLSKIYDEKDMAEKIIYLLKNPKISEQIGKHNLQRIKENFSVKQMADSYLKLIYDKVSK